jgi:TP901 family phage tail tape measure protein
MAFTLSTIYKVVDKFTPVMKQMERANASFAMKQDAAYRKLRGTMSNMNNQLLAMAGGLSIGSLLYTGTNAVVQYDEALNSLSAITGITGKDFEAFKKEVVEVSSRTKKAGYETAKAFELIGSAQPELLKDAKALSTVTESAIILSKASRDDLAVSAANLTGVLNQFSLGADQANRAINVLAAGSVVGAATISEVTEAMKNVGAVASTSNASVEETVALIEVLGKFQLKGAEAGTKLRGTFIKLQQAGLGYQSGQFKINDALADAQKKMNALRTEKEKDAFVTKLFGLENVTAGKILMNNTKLFEEYTKGVTGTDWATKQAEINSASFSVKLKELKARFENLIIKGNENSKALNTFGKVIGFVTNNLDKILVVILPE